MEESIYKDQTDDFAITPEYEDASDENAPRGDLADESAPEGIEEEMPEADYTLDEEMQELTEQFPEIVEGIKNTDPERYSELRRMGLSMKEAYLATGERKRVTDTRGHLRDGMPRAARSPSSTISRREMEIARSLFEGMSDEQIRKLYNKVKS